MGKSIFKRNPFLWLAASLALVASGCATHTESGALMGGLGGAGVGALVGHATGNTAAGAAIGAGVGALTGAAIGNSQDEMEKKNRAMIEAQLGRRVAVGAVTTNDVVAMTQARINEDVIINHIRAHGMATVLQTNDLIMLNQQGVSPRVVAAMQAQPTVVQQPQTVIVEERAPPAVVVGGYYRPYYYHHPRYYW